MTIRISLAAVAALLSITMLAALSTAAPAQGQGQGGISGTDLGSGRIALPSAPSRVSGASLGSGR